MLIDVYSHCVKVKPRCEADKRVILGFVRRLVQWEMEMVDDKPVYKVMKVYAFENPSERSFRFHINLLKDFKDHLETNCTREQLSGIAVTVHKFKLQSRHNTKFQIKNMFDPRDDQIPVIEHLMERGDPDTVDIGGVKVPLFDNNKTITLRTGGGKTFITKKVMSEESLRTFIMMRGGYLDRWIPDLEETFRLKGEAIQIVQGGNSLSAIMQNHIDGLSDKVQIYLVSTDTFVDYITHYERHGVTEMFPIAPTEFMDRMNIGATVIDEGHQMPHRIMKFFSYLHVFKHTTLTATLDTMDKFMDRMLSIMYPKDERFSGPKVDPHIAVTAFQYKLANRRRVRFTGWKGSYNHTQLEQSLMHRKNKDLFEEYVEMVRYLLKTRYVDKDLPGTKALVFFATVDMCTRVTKELQKTFPDKKVVRYIAKDKMSVMDEADIIVSTVLSAGTAVDIPNLMVSIMTTAIDSQQSNEQTVGRTRPLKSYPDVNPEFIYFVCTDIDKHMDYHRNKERFFKDKVKSHVIEHSGYNIGLKREASQGRGTTRTRSDDLDRVGSAPANKNWYNKLRSKNRRPRGPRRNRR